MLKIRNCKQVLALVLLIFSMVSLSTIVAAVYPKLSSGVNDYVGILSADEVILLESKIEYVQNLTSSQIVIAIMQNTEGDERVLYASNLADENGIGKSGIDNGILVLWSLEDEFGGAIVTGRGMETYLTDAEISRIGSNCRNYLYEAYYYNGFDCILDGIALSIGDENSEVSVKPQKSFLREHWIIGIIVLIVIMIIIIYLINMNNTGGRVFRATSYVGRSMGSFGSFGSGSSGFGGSFGGGSFGGGGGRF